MDEPNTVSIGDRVLVRSLRGDTVRQDVVSGLMITQAPRTAEGGKDVLAAYWADVRADLVVVDLKSGHWAWGWQVKPWNTETEGKN